MQFIFYGGSLIERAGMRSDSVRYGASTFVAVVNLYPKEEPVFTFRVKPEPTMRFDVPSDLLVLNVPSEPTLYLR